MKTKLLKKIRKRYNWYFNKEGFPILIDNYRLEATIIDLNYCMIFHNIKAHELDSLIRCSHQEWALRTLKIKILSNYGYTLNGAIYKKALKKYREKLIK